MEKFLNEATLTDILTRLSAVEAKANTANTTGAWTANGDLLDSGSAGTGVYTTWVVVVRQGKTGWVLGHALVKTAGSLTNVYPKLTPAKIRTANTEIPEFVTNGNGVCEFIESSQSAPAISNKNGMGGVCNVSYPGWVFARKHTDGGSIGVWPESSLTAGTLINFTVPITFT